MRFPFPVPIALYAVAGLFLLFFSRRAGGLKCVLATSYCGIIITSFTGGTSGGVWLAAFFFVTYRHSSYLASC